MEDYKITRLEDYNLRIFNIITPLKTFGNFYLNFANFSNTLTNFNQNITNISYSPVDSNKQRVIFDLPFANFSNTLATFSSSTATFSSSLINFNYHPDKTNNPFMSYLCHQVIISVIND